jgi:biopolymer transport protein ExbB
MKFLLDRFPEAGHVTDFLSQGGPVMIPILVLSVVLYSRCCKFLLDLRRSHRELDAMLLAADPGLPAVRQMRTDARNAFRQQRIALGALVAAAPLLGLLGTVSGMVETFQGLAAQANGKSMSSLARGISQVLVATESGLAVAIPALLAIYFVHGRVRRFVQRLDRVETNILQGARP